MPVFMRYTFVCDQCQTGVEDSRFQISMDPRFQLMHPSLPEGWSGFMELLLCEKHHVKYEITND